MSERRCDEIVDPTKVVGYGRVASRRTDHYGVSQCDRETKPYRK